MRFRLMRSPRARIVLGGVLGAFVLFLAGGFATSSPALCGSCHEMGPRTETWKQSAHAEVKCVECHVKPMPWYAFPQRAVAHGALLQRDVVKHFSGRYTDPVDSRVEGVEPMADEVCLQCHDPNRKATSGFRIKIDHGKHAARNKACISCHVRTAHPRPTRGKALSLMTQCYTCHGQPDKPKASTKCDVCHPSGFQLLPASHAAKRWMNGHGAIAKQDLKQCLMCHRQSLCDDCHGMEMPHPAKWEQGRTGHAAVALADRESCTKCHGTKQDWCAMCHHEGYDPTRGTWIRQHYNEVRSRGAGFCLDCHSPVYCATCHVKAPGMS